MMMNKNLRQAYVEMHVTTARLRRRADAAQAESERWIDRIKLAKRLGETELAGLARERALRAAEREVKLRAFLALQDERLEYVRELAR
jgi:phage shock protein A